jgi:tRNA 5-methylaminomethyl-2-thiouridine biosynthesis bifunctional protein
MPSTPINGDGHLVAHVPADHGPPIWLAGATFDRDSASLAPTEADATANHARLARLHPGAAAALADAFARGDVQAWVGVRCASGDRRPLVGPVDADAPGLWACTALGSRGLSFAALCAELLAAQWHGEPLPLPVALAKALGTQRL